MQRGKSECKISKKKIKWNNMHRLKKLCKKCTKSDEMGRQAMENLKKSKIVAKIVKVNFALQIAEQ